MKIRNNNIIHGVTRFTGQDSYLFKEGTHFRLYDKLGSHPMTANGEKGVYFAVWAPNAQRVCVMGDFNGWNKSSHPLGARWDSSGIFEGFIPGIDKGAAYKYYIESKENGYREDKRDPFAFYNEIPSKTASIVWDTKYPWKDSSWMKERHTKNSLQSPMSVYEVHLGSWRRVPEEGNRSLTILN